MKILIAPDSYKESLSAAQVAEQIEAGFREIFPLADYRRLPLADGGEGTVEALVAATGGKIVEVAVSGPLSEKVRAFFGSFNSGQSAVIEIAAASGLELVPQASRNPLRTTTFGSGQLIRAALDRGARHLIIGLGGSATCDGGAGMLQALGAKLLDRHGRQIGPGGAALADLARIDVTTLDERLRHCRIEAACDVDNPLLGEKGAAAVFAPQKGATAEMVAQLEANLGHFAEIVKGALGVDIAATPGGGAAGGLGAALRAFLDAGLRPGIDIVSETLGLEQAIMQADLILVGEGRMDSQSLQGKAPLGVARLAQRRGKPVIAIAGSLAADMDSVHQQGIEAVFSVLREIGTLSEALENAAVNLRMSARNVAAVLRLGQRLAPTPAAGA
ncbi:glycerate kinase [Geoalkalibacter ferrihydriticus]|uniref:Glycerate kinase n=2 Tax=Geoalkalibacter ferrihydriticus TaxID=392333 RepID=A0A0C2HWT3_9BACT|nr:glycerate kinase [Geoalkalibacter ferrihydriticus]KIH77242.1 glycerate kinase [Geoalkalibacter ferrihydriticus DSM 17813]SDM23833.1 glycerate kinase [Geoalkalibacter ferrihydriticus]